MRQSPCDHRHLGGYRQREDDPAERPVAIYSEFGAHWLPLKTPRSWSLQQPHVGKMESQPAEPEGGGGVTMRDLVRNALRMRPDRIIVGECRGGEALEMLQAMSTGHEGSMTTVHANTAREALARVELMVGLAAVEIPVSAVRRLIASSITTRRAGRAVAGRKAKNHHDFGDHRDGGGDRLDA